MGLFRRNYKKIEPPVQEFLQDVVQPQPTVKERVAVLPNLETGSSEDDLRIRIKILEERVQKLYDWIWKYFAQDK